MTRQEAYEYLKDYLDSAFNYSNDYETYCYLRDCADTLAPNTPDPDTGLVPCGCGGKAKVWSSEPMPFTGITAYQVGCTECAITTRWVSGKQENAVKAWNQAMGGQP